MKCFNHTKEIMPPHLKSHLNELERHAAFVPSFFIEEIPIAKARSEALCQTAMILLITLGLIYHISIRSFSSSIYKCEAVRVIRWPIVDFPFFLYYDLMSE